MAAALIEKADEFNFSVVLWNRRETERTKDLLKRFPKAVFESDVKKALADGKEKCLERLKSDLERWSLDDIHDSMSRWACFNEQPQSTAAPDSFKINKLPTNLDQSKPKFKNKKNKAKKKNRKQAKTSKRKNRR